MRIKTPSIVRNALLIFFSPGLVLFATMLAIYYSSDEVIREITHFLRLEWFTWPSIEKIIEENGVSTFERTRLAVVLGLVIALLSVPCVCVAITIYKKDYWRSFKPNFTHKDVLGWVALLSLTLSTMFFFSNGYVPITGRRLVAFPPNIWGFSVLALFLYGIFLFILPAAIWAISIGVRHFGKERDG